MGVRVCTVVGVSGVGRRVPGVAELTPNLRDLGGTLTGTGAVIKSDRLLRSALPADTDLSPRGIAWPPAVVVDLRSAPEIQQRGSLSSGTSVHLPLLSQLKPDAHLDGTLIALYRALLDSAPHLLVDLVRTVADNDGPVLIHCAAGKDRTGISIALILRLLGVDHDTVMADYIATNNHIEAIDARLRSLPGNEGRDDLPREYFHVVPDALEQVLHTWDSHTGGVHGWFAQAGGSADLSDRLAAGLLGR